MIGQLLISLALLSPAQGKAAEWKPYNSVKGKYSVSMPTKPTEKKRIVAVAGKTIELTSATARKGLATYIAAYGDLKGANPEAALKAAQADVIALAKGELKDEKDVTLGELPGRELSIEIPKKAVAGGANQTVRLYVAGGRIYELIATVPLAKADDLADDVSSFFDSFQPTGVEFATASAEPKARSKAAATKTDKPKQPAAKGDPNSPAAKAGSMIGGLVGLNPFGAKRSAPPAVAVPPVATPANPAVPKGLGPEWRDFTPPSKEFSAAMPGEPKEVKLTMPSPMGPVNIVVYAVETQDHAYIAAANPLPAGADAPAVVDRVLEGAKQGALIKVPGAKLLSEKKIMHQGFSGRDLTVEVPKGGQLPAGATMRMRIVVAKGKLFQLQAIQKTTGDPMVPAAVPLYFDSLKIL